MRACRGWGFVSVVGVACLLACLLACAGSGGNAVDAALARGDVRAALHAYRRAPSDEHLTQIALAVLLREARSDDAGRSDRALAALQASGERAHAALTALATTATSAQTRVGALAGLAARGDTSAREQLRARLADPDPALQALAVRALDARSPEDAARLRELAVSPAAVVRKAAIERLQAAPAELETRVVLMQALRGDPALPVRLVALRALAAQGPLGVDAIEAQLADPEQALRLAAIGELVRADYARAALRLSELLAGEPTAEGVESARTLLAVAPVRAPESAVAHLQRALVARDNALRGAAAVALMSMRDARAQQLAAARAALEPVRSVRLCLVLALEGAAAQRRQLLIALMDARDVVATQAAAELARRGDLHAARVLRSLLSSPDAAVRSVAADAIARDLDRPRAISGLLLDADAGVRLRAASAILAG